MFHGPALPTLEYGLIVHAVGSVLQRISGAHAVPQSALSPLERSVLLMLQNVRNGIQTDNAVIAAAIEDWRWRGFPYSLDDELRKR